MVNRKENTKQAILKAMVMLLKTESFDDITTVKLSKRAGISRSSFYTHYKDKYEMIDYYQQTFFHKLEYIFEKNIKIKNKPSLKYLNFSKENSFSLPFCLLTVLKKYRPLSSIKFAYSSLLIYRTSSVPKSYLKRKKNTKVST